MMAGVLILVFAIERAAGLHDAVAVNAASRSFSRAEAVETNAVFRHQVVLGAAAQMQVLESKSAVPLLRDTGATIDKPNRKSVTLEAVDEAGRYNVESQMITKKPVGDHRQYQHARLPNGLQVVNVHDPSTKSAAFAVAVEAGLYYDPHDHYGLAHLTEHALYLGTERFPERSGFDEFLAKHGGMSNAYTAEEVTVFYGNLNHAGFAEGLRRFADMFRAPLLNQSAIWQEVSAVVSEHSKNIQDPAWYSERVMLSVASPASPIQHFHTGDANTLKNLGSSNLTKEIQSYFDLNYCPPRMRLVTFGPESLPEQLSRSIWAFGGIPRRGKHGICEGTKKLFEAPAPFTETRLRKFILVQGTQNTATLWLHFPLWDLEPWRKSHPLNYAGYVLGWGGKGSLTLLLRDHLGLAQSVNLQSEDSSAGTMVWITVSLTTKGLQKPQAVMDIIFTFLKHAKRRCSLETITSLAKSARLMWNWPSPAEASTAASTIAEAMTRVEVQDLLSAEDLIEEPNRTRVLEVLGKLVPERMNVGLVMPEAAHLWGDRDKSVQTLAHYGVKYKVSTLDNWAPNWPNWGATTDDDDENMTRAYAQLAQRLASARVDVKGSIALVPPGAVQGIPEDLNLRHATAEKGADAISQIWGVSPKPLLRSNKMELWFRQGWVRPAPWIEASMTLRTRKRDHSTPSPRSVVTLQLGMRLLAEELSRRLADVGYAGFSFSVSETHLGTHVWLGGFTPNVLNLTRRLLREMDGALDISDHPSLARNLASLTADVMDNTQEPIRMAMLDLKVLLMPGMHSKAELAHAINTGPAITFEDAKNAVQAARRKDFYVTTVVLGNYAQEQTKELHHNLLKGLGARAGVAANEVERVSKVVMPSQPIEVRRRNPREGDQNHVTIVTLLLGPATVEDRVLLGIVGQIYSQVVFAELRTRQELGYVVGGSVSEMSTVLTADCYVQGDKKLPDEIEGLCEHVWAVTVPQQLASLEDSAFNAHKESFRSSLLEGPLSQNQELTHFEDSILLGSCLNLRSSMLRFLETVVSRTQLLEAWRRVVMPANGNHAAVRKKVVVKYFGDGVRMPAVPTVHEAERLLRQAGLTGGVAERMIKERNVTRVLTHSNSQMREALVSEGGFFPTELQCTWEPPASQSSHVPNVMQKGKLAIAHAGHSDTAVAIAADGTKSLMRTNEYDREVSQHSTASSQALSGSSGLSSQRRRLTRPLRQTPLQPQPLRLGASIDGDDVHRLWRLAQLPSVQRLESRRPPWMSLVMGSEPSLISSF